ncbi:hypothetical protein BHE74_00041208 [Ensete ventricosum]|nr:hypothetical protein GW17_00053453 [Ensete ventricosum]RWW52399.1 hypothetical protein BHE74_00041208 [Ensete ventricosum]RZS10729.1 hypothetical protein BHM03_00041989 [Ensete ventricosum]
MVSMSLMHGQPKAKTSHPGIAFPPVVSPTPAQLIEAWSTSDVQEIPAKDATRCTPEEQASDAPLEVNLAPLTRGTWIWHDGEASLRYLRGTQIPRLATDLYTLSYEVLIDQAIKSMVLMETELLKMAQAKDRLRAEIPREVIEDYKKSPGFEMGLVQMGRVSL